MYGITRHIPVIWRTAVIFMRCWAGFYWSSFYSWSKSSARFVCQVATVWLCDFVFYARCWTISSASSRDHFVSYNNGFLGLTENALSEPLSWTLPPRSDINGNSGNQGATDSLTQGYYPRRFIDPAAAPKLLMHMTLICPCEGMWWSFYAFLACKGTKHHRIYGRLSLLYSTDCSCLATGPDIEKRVLGTGR